MSHDECGSGCCQDEFAQFKQMALQPDGTYLITGEMVIGDLVAAFPKAAAVMLSHGLHCVGCHANSFDTVEDGARLHGIPDEEIAEMIGEINEVVNHRIETIEMTDRAVAKVIELRSQEPGKEDWPLRIKVLPGEDGFGYEMDFDRPKPNDTTIPFGALQVLIGLESLDLLKGSSIDYIDSLRGSGFKIENPNKACCGGCGNH